MGCPTLAPNHHNRRQIEMTEKKTTAKQPPLQEILQKFLALPKFKDGDLRAFYRFYPEDYLNVTASLTYGQHGAYHLLLHEFYCSRRPIPLDNERISRILRAVRTQDKDDIQFVLKKHWIETEHGWVNLRAMKEILARQKPRAPKPTQAKAEQPLATTAPPSLHPINEIPLMDGSSFTVGQECYQVLMTAYPKVAEFIGTGKLINIIAAWNYSNKRNRKTRRGIMRHLNAWFKKEEARLTKNPHKPSLNEIVDSNTQNAKRSADRPHINPFDPNYKRQVAEYDRKVNEAFTAPKGNIIEGELDL